MRVISPAVVIAAKDLRQRIRDRSILIQGVIGPLAMAAVIGLAFGSGPEVDVRLALVDEDGSEISARVVDGFVAGIPEDTPIEVAELDSEAQALDQVRAGDLDAALLLPDGFGERVLALEAPELPVVVDPTSQLGDDVALGVAEGIAARLRAGQLAVRTTLAAGSDQFDPSALDPASIPVGVTLEEEPVGGEWQAVAYFAPSMAMIFLFFTLGTGAQSLLTERRTGTLSRILAGPVPNSSVLLGKAGAVVMIGLLSLFTIYGVTTLLFGTDWGDPVGVLSIVVGVVVAVGGLTILVVGFARTDDQATGLTAIVTFALALLGGNFISPGFLPPVLERARFFTPNGWALQAFTDLSAGKAGVVGVLPAFGVLLAMGLITGAAGMVLLRRRGLV